MIAEAGDTIGHGRAFGISEFLDRLGSLLGPLIIALLLSVPFDYRVIYLFLSITAVSSVLALVVLTKLFKDKTFQIPNRVSEKESTYSLTTKDTLKSLSGDKLYLFLIRGLVALGFVDFIFIGHHLKNINIVSENSIPLFLTLATCASAISSLLVSKYFDKNTKFMAFVMVGCGLVYSPLVFLGGKGLFIMGLLFWGVVQCFQLMVVKSMIAPTSINRAVTFGLIDLVYGLGLFVGSWLMGFLYSLSAVYLVAFSMIVHALAIMVIKRYFSLGSIKKIV